MTINLPAVAAALRALADAISTEETAAPATKGKKKAAAPEATPPAPAPTAAPAPAPAAAPVPVAQVPAAAAPIHTIKQTTEKVIELANDYSREAAVTILTKRGVNKCSELKPETWDEVFDEAEEAIEAARAKAANASLV